VLVTNTVNGESLSVTAAVDGSFSASLPAAGGEALTLVVKDAYGQSSAGISLTVPLSVIPVHLSITYPPAGLALDSAFTRVQGTHDGPANTGITVNGQPAQVYNGQFAALVPLQAGANSLNAIASTLQGEAGQASVSVSSPGGAPALSLNASSQTGLAPLAISFEYQFSGTPPFNFNFDFEGDGIADITGSNTDSLPAHTYPAPGFYFPMMTITDTQGQVYRAETLVLAQDGAAMDALFSEMWNGMNDALMLGNKDEAMKYLNAGAQRKYGPVFDVLMPHIAEIVASYSPLARSEISEHIGEYAIVRPYEGVRRLFFVYFLRNKDGVWLVDEM
jgi:PKD repeat protein